MSEKGKSSSNSTIYTRINELPLTRCERSAALQALRDGEAIADSILAVYGALRNLFPGAILKHGFRH